MDYTASSVFENLINNESALSDGHLVAMFGFGIPAIRGFFTDQGLGLRTINYTPYLSIAVKTADFIPGYELNSNQKKFRALLIRLVEQRLFEKAVKHICKDSFDNKEPEEVIPNYKAIISACEIKEDELLDALTEFNNLTQK